MQNETNPIPLPSFQETLDAYVRRKRSPVEVTQEYLDRIAALDPGLGAYTAIYAEAALQQARASEHRLLSGMPIGLLEGIPLGVKDLLNIAGYTTTAGSSLFTDGKPAPLTSTVVNRLLSAGAIILGKTHLVEFAYGGWGTNRALGTPKNPWDLQTARAPGGSSSGSGVAVAAGLAAGAIGTDTGGSVRIPAAYCGITGLKTTQGRISNHGVEHVSFTLDTVGPMTHHTADAARILQAIHGPDPAAPETLPFAPEDFLSDIDRPIKGTRICLLDPYSWGDVNTEVAEAVFATFETFAKLGCIRQDAPASSVNFSADQEETGVIISSEAYSNWGLLLEGKWDEGDAYSRARISAAKHISAAQYAKALHTRQHKKQIFLQVFQHTDILMLPTVPEPAAPLSRLDEHDLSPSRLTRFVGYYGLSAISLPCGHTRSGLPIGVQLVAAPFMEALLLRLGHAFQRETGFHLRQPVLDFSIAR